MPTLDPPLILRQYQGTLSCHDTVEAPDVAQLARILFARWELIRWLCRDVRVQAAFRKMRRDPEHQCRVRELKHRVRQGEVLFVALPVTIFAPNPALGNLVSQAVRNIFQGDFQWVSGYLLQQFLAAECERASRIKHSFSISAPRRRPETFSPNPIPDTEGMTAKDARKAETNWSREQRSTLSQRDRKRGRVPKTSKTIASWVKWYVRHVLEEKSFSALAKQYLKKEYPLSAVESPSQYATHIPHISRSIKKASTLLGLPVSLGICTTSK